MKCTVKAKIIFGEERVIEDGYIIVEDDLIQSVSEGSFEGEMIDLQSITLVPGFLDIHVHGGDMFDMMDMSCKELAEFSHFKLKEGVTSFCPTTVTASLEKTKKAVETVRDTMNKGVGGANIIGSFLEGPYINALYKGAHPEQLIRSVNLSEIENLIKTGKGSICSFAIAPELTGADEAISFLKKNNVNVRIGHSATTCEQANNAIKKGANVGIHTYNAMSPLNHREPGLVGAILSNENIYSEIICDLVHVDVTAINILLKCKGVDKIILITDCMMAGGVSDGEYMLGELGVSVVDGVCRTHSGALAGSTLSINKAIKNMVNEVKVSLYDAVKMATINPAKALCVDEHIGSIKAGKQADLVGLDENLDVRFVMVGGKVLINTQ